ncbi:MAG TPA: DUF4384 domain-containing protein [Bryobacteraceae bacterium]|nr:DUF4384 domain-containing protein [Bryobacteraceae bacterium]
MISRGHRFFIAITGIIPGILAAQTPPRAAPPNLSAREIFYSPGPAQAAAKPAASARKKSAPPAGKPAEPAPDTAVASNGTQHSASTGSSGSAVPSGIRAPVINAADRPRRALGLRYTIEKVSNGVAEPMGIHSVFHSGDRIRIGVEVNDSAYLYVISRGSSGTWSPLFPSKDVEDGSNRVEPGQTYQIPPGSGHVIAFREPSGSERLFIVVSREPEQSLERLIYSMNGGSGRPAAASPAPSRPAESDSGAKVLMASAQPIGDDTVGGLRAYSRDLIVEDASQENQGGSNGTRSNGARSNAAASNGAGPDKSFYAVNPTGSADSRVVADITLNHQ